MNRIRNHTTKKTASVQSSNGHAPAKSGHLTALDLEIQKYAIGYRQKFPLACDAAVKQNIRKRFSDISFTDGDLNAHLGIAVETPETRMDSSPCDKALARAWYDRIDRLEKAVSQATTLYNLMFIKLDYDADPESRAAAINYGILNLCSTSETNLLSATNEVRQFVNKNFIIV